MATGSARRSRSKSPLAARRRGRRSTCRLRRSPATRPESRHRHDRDLLERTGSRLERGCAQGGAARRAGTTMACTPAAMAERAVAPTLRGSSTWSKTRRTGGSVGDGRLEIKRCIGSKRTHHPLGSSGASPVNVVDDSNLGTERRVSSTRARDSSRSTTWFSTESSVTRPARPPRRRRRGALRAYRRCQRAPSAVSSTMMPSSPSPSRSASAVAQSRSRGPPPGDRAVRPHRLGRPCTGGNGGELTREVRHVEGRLCQPEDAAISS